MALENPFALLCHDMAIDLGTANCRVAMPGRGVVLDEPAVLAVKEDGAGRQVLAVGAAAREMLGRTPEGIRAMRPMEAGKVESFEVLEAILRFVLLRAVGRRPFLRPRLLLCVPAGTTEMERGAIEGCARSAGGGDVRLVSAPLAAAVGADLPLGMPIGNLICDIGAGLCQVAVVSLAGVVTHCRSEHAGDAMDRAIIDYTGSRHGILVGERSAEALKFQLGLGQRRGDAGFSVKGRQLSSGLPRAVTLDGAQSREAFEPVIGGMIQSIRRVLAHTPPELAADIAESGMVLTGGGACMDGLPEALRDGTGLPVILAPDPLRAPVLGACRALDDPYLLQRLTRAS